MLNDRITSLYIVMPAILMDTPIPMGRMSYTDADDKKQYYTANQVWPKARKSLNGSQAIISFSPNNFEKELIELQSFPDREKVKLLSWVEAKALMQTKEWMEEEKV